MEKALKKIFISPLCLCVPSTQHNTWYLEGIWKCLSVEWGYHLCHKSATDCGMSISKITFPCHQGSDMEICTISIIPGVRGGQNSLKKMFSVKEEVKHMTRLSFQGLQITMGLLFRGQVLRRQQSLTSEASQKGTAVWRDLSLQPCKSPVMLLHPQHHNWLDFFHGKWNEMVKVSILADVGWIIMICIH